MNKLKLVLIVIAPLFIASLALSPIIISSYKNYKDSIKYSTLKDEEKKLVDKLKTLNQEKNKLDIKVDQINNSKEKINLLETDYNSVKAEISSIEKKMKEYDKKITTQKKLNNKVKEYVY